VTTANRGAAIAEEVRRAEQALAAADHLARGGFFADAVSRLYYSLLCRVRALLLTVDIEVKSHEGALRQLSLHFVKPGTIAPEALHLFSRLMKYREEADYNPSYVFTEDDVRTMRAECATFAEALAGLIRAAGYRP
jgi:uncharacterized protein (UPF0332 family)